MGASNLRPIEYQILVDNKKGGVFELPVTSATWKTQRTDRAGSLEFEFVGGDKFSDKTFELNAGDIIRLEVSGQILFYGYVFTVENSGGETFSGTAYDQVRYLMYSDTYVFTGKTATEIIKQIAGDFGITLGTIADTGYVIPKLAQDNKKLLDMISEALAETNYNTGRYYVLYDKCGAMTLTDIADMRLNIALGNDSMLTDYNYKESIDSNTYNVIKLQIGDSDSGSTRFYIYPNEEDGGSTENIAKWGILQYFASVDSGYNDAMIKARAKSLFDLNNRLEKTFKLDARGDVTCRAGKTVYVGISSLGVAQYYVIESADHSFDGNDYSMSLTLKVVD